MADLSLAQERAIRESSIEQVISWEDRGLIAEAIEAYKRNLPKLLAGGNAYQKVAYRGTQQIGIASTYHKLERFLKTKGYTDERELFITCITPMEGVD